MLQKSDEPKLSDRERTVLLLAADGLTDKEIASNLSLSLKTIGTYWDRMRQKFQASSRTQVLARFLRLQAADTEDLGHLARLFAVTEHGVWVIGRSGETIYVNGRAAALLGRAVESGQPKVKDVLSEIGAQKLYRVITQAKDEPQSSDMAIKTPDGQTCWLAVRALPFEDAKGRARATVVHLYDMTVQKQCETALEFYKSSLGSLLDNSTDPVARFDAELRCVYVNPAFQELHDVEPDGILGTPLDELSDLFSPNGRWVRHVRRALKSGQPQGFDCHVPGNKSGVPATLVPEPTVELMPTSVISIARIGSGPRKDRS